MKTPCLTINASQHNLSKSMNTLFSSPHQRKTAGQGWLAGFVLALSALVSACATQPNAELPQSPQGDIRFLDVQSFDQRLGQSLGAGVDTVSVSFYDKLTPSQLPERLQSWMAAVEVNGGKVDVQQPPSSSGMTAKSPFLVISGLVSLWSAKKALDEIQRKRDFANAGNYDATIRLTPDTAGNFIIQTVTFNKRPRAQ